MVWDETLKLQTTDNEYRRRDLHKAIHTRDFPEWELGIQVLTKRLPRRNITTWSIKRS
jgi:catalase